MLALIRLYLALDPPAPQTALDATLLQYGIVGAIASGGIWFALRTYRREVRRADALAAELNRVRDAHAAEVARLRDAHAAELRQIHTTIQDRTVPLLTEAVRVMGDVSARERRERR